MAKCLPCSGKNSQTHPPSLQGGGRGRPRSPQQRLLKRQHFPQGLSVWDSAHRQETDPQGCLCRRRSVGPPGLGGPLAPTQGCPSGLAPTPSLGAGRHVFTLPCPRGCLQWICKRRSASPGPGRPPSPGSPALPASSSALGPGEGRGTTQGLCPSPPLGIRFPPRPAFERLAGRSHFKSGYERFPGSKPNSAQWGLLLSRRAWDCAVSLLNPQRQK